MLLRISLIIAVIAGLGVAGLNIALVKEKITTLVTDRDTQKKDKETAQTSLTKTTKELKDTKTELVTTKENLKTTTEAKDKAEADVADLTKKNEGLADNLKKTQEKLGATSDELASWKAFGIGPDVMKQKLDAINKITAQRDTFASENKVLVGKVANLTAKINDLINPETDGPQMTAGLKGKILVSDPKYDFVVLDIGQNQGVVERGRFLVNRNGKLVAKLKVQTVEANRCIANVMPGWKLGDVFEGDQVIY
jgi:hypothetical protein